TSRRTRPIRKAGTEPAVVPPTQSSRMIFLRGAVCGRSVTPGHLGAQIGRRGDAGPARGSLGGQDPAGRFLMSAPPAAEAGWPAANSHCFIGPLEAGESDNELVGVRREDRADASAGTGCPRVLGHAVRLMAAAESGPPALAHYVPVHPAARGGQGLEVMVRDVLPDLPAQRLPGGGVETPVDPGVDPALAGLLRRLRELPVRPLHPLRLGREADLVGAEEGR